ncbi:fungal-specific transcription factor domain-containing protein [Dactylonectria estremocensis]|uniref:Fungal-specific transcription factor domain-containing protein n=1 Tax=Dactylonectria estremocensis TaxID=1079267 RepID=A0A9P9IYF3_9HYPO|nr:fungal-specific transcription factor domain-containing protein [Dactylonectria estremocensis]
MNTPHMQRGTVKGCRVCERRRIRCDFEHPFCQKCRKKGLTCPGYGPRLKWVDGIAARGRLKGKKVPVHQSVISDDDQAVELPMSTTDDLGSLGPSEATSQYPSVNTDFISFTSGLLEYYGKNIAGLMVWLDTDQNDYRRRVLPLAKSEPGLRFAVAAISVHHGSALFPDSPPDFPQMARDACLGFIQRSAEEMTHKLSSGSVLDSGTDVVSAEWMLASILIMICFEMGQSRLEAAECHRQAARRLINIFSSTIVGSSELFGFLRNQLSIHDVLASTTSFNLQDLEMTIVPRTGPNTALFSEYLSVLHRVTLQSRRASCLASDAGSPSFEKPLCAETIRSQFEQARGATLMAAGRLHFRHSSPSRDLVHLVETYHNAALLYSYRCIGLQKLDHATNLERQTLALRLPDQLLKFDDHRMCIQNLPWPALIAGTECHGNSEHQTKVINVFLDIYGVTRFKHYLEIIEFLRAFWDGSQLDWQVLAQDWEAAGRRIIAV